MTAFTNPHERPQSETIGTDLVPYFIIEENEAQTRYVKSSSELEFRPSRSTVVETDK